MSLQWEKNETNEIIPRSNRAIGTCSGDHGTYIEDYAYTYIHQFAAQQKGREQVAVLVGHEKVQGETKVLLIHGAIQVDCGESEGEVPELTDDILKQVESIQDRYFQDCSRVGWVFSQPGLGVVLTASMVKQHYAFFNEGQVLFVLDPVDKVEVMFQTENGVLVEKPGFYIYYDKNISMQNYMLDFKVSDYEGERKVEDVVLQLREKEKVKKEEEYQKRFINLLLVLSGALMILCILIGMGLMNNIEQVNALKQSMNNFAYDYNSPLTINGTEEEISTMDEDIPVSLTEEGEQPEETIEVTEVLTEMSTEVPEVTETVTEATEQITEYTVRAGDNLIRISYMFYNSKNMVDEIQELNNIEDPGKIYVGQVLRLP